MKKIPSTVIYPVCIFIFLVFTFSCSYMALEGLEDMFSQKAIVSFSFDRSLNPDLTSDASGVISGNRIYVTVPYGTDLSSLTPSINMVGSSINPGKNVERSFTSSSVYTVGAEDGTTATYTVYVIQGSGDSKNIVSFAFTETLNGSLDYDVFATISDNSVDLILPAGTPPGSFIPTIAISGVSVSPDNLSPYDIADSPVEYTVTAVNGTTKTYFVSAVISDDTTKPVVPDPVLTTGTITQHTVRLSWEKAADNVTTEPNLDYKLVRSSSPITDADNLAGTDIVMDWTADTTGYTAQDLSDDTWYYFNVLVRDEGGNLALYSHEYVKTLVDAAPVLPDNTITPGTVTTSSVQLSWTEATDDVTPAGSLQYKLVRSASPITDAGDADLLLNPDLVMDWTPDTTDFNAADLSADTWYYFNVLVKDEKDQLTLYNQLQVQTAADAAPTLIDGTISSGSITAGSANLSWTEATDDITANENLQYKLVRSLSAITTISTANDLTGDNVVMDWTGNISLYTALGLTHNTLYYFNVLVRDELGQMALYTQQTVQTLLDNTNPVVSDPVLTSINVTNNTIELSWNDASDDVTSTGELEYKLVRSTSPITSVTTAETITGPDLVMDWTKDINSATAIGMTMDTWFHFNVLVKDKADNKTLYTPKAEKTLMNFSSNLIARYSFSNNFNDSSGNGLTLVESGSLGYTNNRTPNALSAAYFGSGTDHYYKNSTAALNPGTELTISLWIQFSNVNKDQKIIGKVNTSKNRGYVLGVRNGNIYLEIWDENGIRYSLDKAGINTPLVPGSWIHLAMTWETNEKLKAYIGGELVGEITTGSQPIGTNGDNLIIGACPWPSGGTLMVEDGAIDDIRIYNDVLSAYEIYYLSNLAAD